MHASGQAGFAEDVENQDAALWNARVNAAPDNPLEKAVPLNSAAFSPCQGLYSRLPIASAPKSVITK